MEGAIRQWQLARRRTVNKPNVPVVSQFEFRDCVSLKLIAIRPHRSLKRWLMWG